MRLENDMDEEASMDMERYYLKLGLVIQSLLDRCTFIKLTKKVTLFDESVIEVRVVFQMSKNGHSFATTVTMTHDNIMGIKNIPVFIKALLESKAVDANKTSVIERLPR